MIFWIDAPPQLATHSVSSSSMTIPTGAWSPFEANWLPLPPGPSLVMYPPRMLAW